MTILIIFRDHDRLAPHFKNELKSDHFNKINFVYMSLFLNFKPGPVQKSALAELLDRNCSILTWVSRVKFTFLLNFFKLKKWPRNGLQSKNPFTESLF